MKNTIIISQFVNNIQATITTNELMKTHRLIIYEQSIIKSNNDAINNLLDILNNFGYIDQSINYKNVNKNFINVIPKIRVNKNDCELLSKTKSWTKENYDVIMKYINGKNPKDIDEIIFTMKQINIIDQNYVYAPKICKINVILNDDIVELHIVIKYNLKQRKTFKKLKYSELPMHASHGQLELNPILNVYTD